MRKNYFKELIADKALMKTTIVLAIPIMFQNLVVSLVTLVDNLMVGLLGDAAISGVATANKYYTIIFFIINAMVMACVIFMAQFNGAGNREKMQESFRFSIVSSFILLIIFVVIVKTIPVELIKFVINDPDVIEMGTRYIKVVALSYLPLGISMPVAGAMRSVGDSKNPMIISIISVLVNGLLDYCLIFGKFGFPELNIEGAAIATVIARVVEALLLIVALKKGDYVFDTELKDLFDFDKELAIKIVLKALPLVINEMLFQIGETMKLKAYSYRGALVNTGYSIYATVADLFFILFGGMAVATTVLVGTELGANHLEKAKDNGYKLLVFSVFLAVFFSLGLFGSKLLVPVLFKDISIEAINVSKSFLTISGCLFFIYMFNCQCYFLLRAGGDTKATLIMDSGFLWLVVIPLAFILSKGTNLSIFMVYGLVQMSEFLKMIISFMMVRKEKWIKNLAN